jgi:hypothetical protein
LFWSPPAKAVARIIGRLMITMCATTHKNPPEKADGFLPVGEVHRQRWVSLPVIPCPMEEQKELKQTAQ